MKRITINQDYLARLHQDSDVPSKIVWWYFLLDTIRLFVLYRILLYYHHFSTYSNAVFEDVWTLGIASFLVLLVGPVSFSWCSCFQICIGVIERYKYVLRDSFVIDLNLSTDMKLFELIKTQLFFGCQLTCGFLPFASSQIGFARDTKKFNVVLFRYFLYFRLLLPTYRVCVCRTEWAPGPCLYGSDWVSVLCKCSTSNATHDHVYHSVFSADLCNH